MATSPQPVDFDGARRTDERAYAALFQAMLAEGVAMAPGAYEAIFVGLGHDDAVIEQIGDAAVRAARTAVADCRYPGLMRQVLSWRFVAAIVAVAAFALVVYILGSRAERLRRR